MVDYGRKWCHFSFTGICEPICNSIVYRRRMVKSIYVI